MERETGFEPATSTLARLHSTTELFPRFVRAKGLEPPCLAAPDPKSGASASSATLALLTNSLARELFSTIFLTGLHVPQAGEADWVARESNSEPTD